MFAIELPLGTAPQPVLLAPSPVSSAGRRIGLVEDNPQVLAALAMEHAGHTVLAGTSGARMLEQLGEQAPDIVISDYRLAEGATGHAVVAAARARFGVTLPALILTSDTDPKLIGSLASQGIAVHFKPLPMDALQGYIQQAIERRPT